MTGPEEPFFFDNDGGPLFGVFHPARTVSTRQPYVFCHPFGEEKLWAHRIFVSFARALAERGCPVLRFDYRGNGDSAGAFSQWTPEAAILDISAAIGRVQQLTGAERVGLLGLRLGASLAAAVAERRKDVGTLILWEPVIGGAAYAQELLRINVSTQMAAYREVRRERPALMEALRNGETVNVDGYDMSGAAFEQLTALDLAGAQPSFKGPCMVVHIHRPGAAVPSTALQALSRGYSDAAFTAVAEEPFWKEIKQFYDAAPNLFAATLEWIERR